MSRLLWFGFGVAAGVALVRKTSTASRKVTPEGMAENVGNAVRELASAVGSFGAEVRAGMAERETELYSTVESRTGINASPRNLLRGGSPAGQQAAAGQPSKAGSPARARRAEGSVSGA